MARSTICKSFGAACRRSGQSMHRNGMTLLEVLVACGILVFALSGIAAILPAAGSRLAESVAEDRAALMAANVYAELNSRQLFKASLFTGVPNVNASPNLQSEALVLGNLGPTGDWTAVEGDATIKAQKMAPFFFTNPFSPSSSGTSAVDRAFDAIWPYASMRASVDNCRGFFLEDELAYTEVNGLPTSVYEVVASGTSLGPRAFKRGVTWGATLARLTTGTNPPTPGAPAQLSVAVFKKAADARGIDLEQISPTLYRLPAGQETIRSTYLKPCSYVLALPIGSSASPPPGPQWLRINSSWTVQSTTASGRVSYVTLPAEADKFFDGTSKVLCVIGFSNLIRVDVFPVTLE
jgi:type II secretory pathway pseudopilin PulG